MIVVYQIRPEERTFEVAIQRKSVVVLCHFYLVSGCIFYVKRMLYLLLLFIDVLEA